MRTQVTNENLADYLLRLEQKPQLRLITCGSVDDGKSTLIGRLLYETRQLFDDQLATLARESRQFGTQHGELDFALLLDGLIAEREQGITIDVAYRFCETEQRQFIIADAPGHVEYTRNMVTGASGADVALLLIDARHGVREQTRRHSFLLSLLGIRHVILAVNKMDSVAYSESVFHEIVADYRRMAESIGLTEIHAIPISALKGDNVVHASEHLPWYVGPTLLRELEQIELDDPLPARALRMPVQWVCRPDEQFRGFAGTLVSGVARRGDQIRVQPSGQEACIQEIVVFQGQRERALTGESVTLVLDREIDVSRGDIIVAAKRPLEVSDQFQAHIVWMADEPLLAGRGYLLKTGARTMNVSITEIKHQIDINTQALLPAKTLALNGIGLCNLKLEQDLPFEPYSDNRELGGFILIDRLSNATVGCGMIRFALRRASNIHHQVTTVSRAERAGMKGQTPRVLWFTGLSGSGKSTIANALEQQLHLQGYHTYLLDGDNVRHGLNKDLGFTDADRVENIRRIGEVAKLMVDAGLVVIAAFISPFRAERDMVRALFAPGEFVEIFVDTSLELAEQRDPKGLYQKARRGELKNFTGVDSAYEAPSAAELALDTAMTSPEQNVTRIIEWLRVHA